MAWWKRAEKNLEYLEHADFIATWGPKIASGLASLGVGKLFQIGFSKIVGALPGESRTAVWLIFSAVIFWALTAIVKLRRSNKSKPTAVVTAITPLRDVPHIDLIYNLPKASDLSFGYLVRDEQIALVNTTDHVAYDVEIQPKESGRYTAKFESVGRLSKDQPAKVEVDIRAKPNGVYYRGFEAVCKWEYEDTPWSPDSFEVHVPLAVRFYDKNHDRQFETLHEVIYDSFWKEAHSRLVRGTQEVPKTQAAS